MRFCPRCRRRQRRRRPLAIGCPFRTCITPPADAHTLPRFGHDPGRSKKRGSAQKAPARKRQARGRGRAASEDEDDSDDGERLEIDEEELIRDEEDRKRCVSCRAAMREESRVNLLGVRSFYRLPPEGLVYTRHASVGATACAYRRLQACGHDGAAARV